MSVRDWSVTAANNDVADSAINWAEDQAPSTVNNSARAMMAELAKYIKDVGGALTATGSSNAYAVTTNETILSHVKPVFLAFKANHTSSGAATIAIDGLTAKPLKRSNGAAIQSGDIVSGCVYLIQYESTADVYLCLNVAGNYDPTAVAITGGTLDGVTLTALNTGLHILDTNATHDLIIAPGSNLTADRTLTVTTGDADRTLTLGGNFTANGGTVSSGTHSGTNTGDQTISLTGDVTGSGTGSFAATIAADAVTNAKAANMAQSTIKGRAVSAGTGDPTDLTATQATAVLDAVVGDSGSGGTKGLVPAPASGDAAANKFLKASGAWAAVSGFSAVQVFTGSGTYTPTAGMQSCLAIVVGGGGGGGGADNSSGAGNKSAGAGGGGGGCAIERLSAATIGASQAVTIGAAGTAGTSSGGTGGTGGTSSLGALLSATGGVGGTGTGQPGGTDGTYAGGAGGAGSGGDLNFTGSAGVNSVSLSTLSVLVGGTGGGSHLGGGGVGASSTTGASTAGSTGGDYGGGGGGATANGTSGAAGGAGAAGVVVILEF